jgi:hypothetical protein
MFFVDRINRKENLPFRSRKMNTCDIKLAMNREDGHNKLVTYHGQDFGDGGNQEPNETLVNGAAYQRTENTVAGEEHQ